MGPTSGTAHDTPARRPVHFGRPEPFGAPPAPTLESSQRGVHRVSDRPQRPIVRIAVGVAAGAGLGLVYSFVSRALGST